MRYLLALLLMSYVQSTASSGLGDYLHQAWDEERWSCLATDRIEHTCNLQVNKPNWRRKR